MNIIVGIAVVILGAVMVWKPRWFLDMVGEQEWAYKVFGAGHGTTAYQAIGVILILVGFLIMTDIIQGIVRSIFAPVLGLQ